jgi:copper homeostasis protein
MKLEIIGFNIESCAIAQEAGANRIELCDNPEEGGTTPSFGSIMAARKMLTIELYVMIRPRGGDFLYSDDDFTLMKSDINICKQLGCDGIVTGILTEEGNVDKQRCKELVNLAYPLGVTFHRAFDKTAEPFLALEDIIETGCERILTSGQHATALEGAKMIRKLILKAEDRISIMPGSGISADNIITIAEITGTTEFHSSAKMMKESKMKNGHPLPGEKSKHIIVNGEAVKNMTTLLKNFGSGK